MIAIDTNVLVRFLTKDDADQAAIATRFFSERTADDPVFVSFVVVAEAVWVLRSRGGLTPDAIAKGFSSLLQAAEFVFEDDDFLRRLFSGDAARQTDVADHLIARLASKAGCTGTVTFDRRAARHIPGMTLLA